MTKSPSLDALFGSTAGGTFLGIPTCSNLDELEADIAILGVPCATPYKSVGAYCKNGPSALRQGVAAFAANLSNYDFDSGGQLLPPGVRAVDCGDLGYIEDKAPENRETIIQAVDRILDKSALPIVLGGDDSVPIPMLQAFAGRGKFTILQIDAHIDWRDSHENERMGLSSTMRRASEMSHIEAIVQIGQRGIGSARTRDYEDALAWGAKLASAREVCTSGVEPALRHITPGSKVIVCFDCDALDPSIMPGVIGRAPGGLDYWAVVALFEGVAASCEIAGVDIVEFMPERDVDGIGALTAGRIAATAMGVMARQRAGRG